MRPLLAAVFSLFVWLPLFAQQQPTLAANAIDKIVQSTMKSWQLPGVAIAIVKNDRVIYVNGYGVKDLTTGEPVTPDTLFQIASTSKAFTTAALAMLVDEGKVSWDDPVRQHVDYFRLADRCANEQVTVRDIVSHRTGVGTHDELWDGRPWSREEVIRMLGEVAPSQPFRGAYEYQNIMFIAAGEVVSHASGMKWDDFVRTRIFQPLGMAHTVTSDADWQTSDHATGYHYDWKTNAIAPQRPISTTTIGSAGAVKSSARDMANWLRFQLANGVFNNVQLVSADTLTETKTPQLALRLEGFTRDSNPETNVLSYGMGWKIQDYRGELLVSHSGSLNGFRTQVNLLPKRNAAFVVMTNVGRGTALVSLRNSLADMLTLKPSRDWNAYYLMVDRKADEKAEKERNERKARRKPNTKPTLPLEAYAGTYVSRSHATAKVSLANGALTMQWAGLTLPLQHFHFDVFSAASDVDDIDEEVAFGISPDGEVNRLTFYGAVFERR